MRIQTNAASAAGQAAKITDGIYPNRLDLDNIKAFAKERGRLPIETGKLRLLRKIAKIDNGSSRAIAAYAMRLFALDWDEIAKLVFYSDADTARKCTRNFAETNTLPWPVSARRWRNAPKPMLPPKRQGGRKPKPKQD